MIECTTAHARPFRSSETRNMYLPIWRYAFVRCRKAFPSIMHISCAHSDARVKSQSQSQILLVPNPNIVPEEFNAVLGELNAVSKIPFGQVTNLWLDWPTLGIDMVGAPWGTPVFKHAGRIGVHNSAPRSCHRLFWQNLRFPLCTSGCRAAWRQHVQQKHTVTEIRNQSRCTSSNKPVLW